MSESRCRSPTSSPNIKTVTTLVVLLLSIAGVGMLLNVSSQAAGGHPVGPFPVANSIAAPGDVDLSFKAGRVEARGVVDALALQPDGKVLLGGLFTGVNGAKRNLIARVSSDGSLDLAFNPSVTVDDQNTAVYTLAMQSDGKILLGGRFTEVNGVSRNAVARLNSDGSLDTTFNPGVGLGSGDTIWAIAPQPNGKILLGGRFSEVNGVSRNNIARLNSDGSLDSSFDPGTGASSTVIALTLQPDGKILLGGTFTFVNDVSHKLIARLNSDGSLDTAFNPSAVGFGNSVEALVLQPDGKVLLGGTFTSVNGISRNRVARLNGDGSLDSGFNPGSVQSFGVRAIALQPDGKVLLGGDFTTINGTSRNALARLNSDGSLDTTFNPGSGANSNSVVALALQPDGKTLVGGGFTTINGMIGNGIARLGSDGGFDATFNSVTGLPGSVSAIALQPDGKVLLGGSFNIINAVKRPGFARLNNDGTLDTAFNPSLTTSVAPDISVLGLASQPDGKVLLGGNFTNVNGMSRNYFARLNNDGSLDTAFNPGTGANNTVFAIALQPDGKVLLGGSFTTINGTSRRAIARLNSDGTLDTTFNPGSGTVPNEYVRALALQPDGKVLLGGGFTAINGVNRRNVARLNSDGSLDSTFNPGTGANNAVNALALQPDGRVLLGGVFTSVNDISHNLIARLNSDGSLDTTFNPSVTGAFQNVPVYGLALQPNGNILLGGDFNEVNGVSRNGVARLNSDGSLDTFFNPALGINGRVLTFALQSDGKIMLGGTFETVNGLERVSIARLLADAVTPTLLQIDNIVPPAGRASGGQQIKLTGAFAGLATVTWGGVSASWSYTNGTSEITVTTPAHVVGAVSIELIPTSGTSYSKPNAFAYLPTIFTDNTLTVGVTKASAQHIIELRQAVDALRAIAGLSPAPWTDAALVPGSTGIKALHVKELRTYLDDAASRLSYPTSPYTDPSLSAGFPVKRVHIEELRQRIRTIAG